MEGGRRGAGKGSKGVEKILLVHEFSPLPSSPSRPPSAPVNEWHEAMSLSREYTFPSRLSYWLRTLRNGR